MRYANTVALTADGALVWRRVSDLEAMPRFWHGVKSLSLIRGEGAGLRAEVRFAFGGAGLAEVVVNDEGKTVVLLYVSGPFTGSQRITVDESSVGAVWDIRFHGVYRLLQPWVSSHIRSGTDHALARLVSAEQT